MSDSLELSASNPSELVLPQSGIESGWRSWLGPLLILFYCLSFLSLKLVQHQASPIHLLYLGGIMGLYFAHSAVRGFFVLCLPMILYSTMYDFFGMIPFEALMPIHVSEPYHWDQALFGINVAGHVYHLHQYVFLKLAHPFWDFVTGVVYFLHVPVVLILVLYFWRFQSRELAQRFTMAFLVINLLAFATYFFFPAAAPWYVERFGFLAPTAPIPGDPAGLVRFEHLLGISIFSDNYKISPVVFGAIPSMHAGFATLGWLYSWQASRKVLAFMSLYLALMYTSALYLQHHYTIDVIWGIAYAIIAWLVIDKILFRPVTKLNEGIWDWFYQRARGTLF